MALWSACCLQLPPCTPAAPCLCRPFAALGPTPAAAAAAGKQGVVIATARLPPSLSYSRASRRSVRVSRRSGSVVAHADGLDHRPQVTTNREASHGLHVPPLNPEHTDNGRPDASNGLGGLHQNGVHADDHDHGSLQQQGVLASQQDHHHSNAHDKSHDDVHTHSHEQHGHEHAPTARNHEHQHAHAHDHDHHHSHGHDHSHDHDHNHDHDHEHSHEHDDEHDHEHGHSHAHGHAHSHGPSSHGNVAQRILFTAAKAIGVVRLADALRENIWAIGVSGALLLVSAVIPYLAPTLAAAATVVKACTAAIYFLIGVPAGLDMVNDLLGGSINIHVLMSLAAFACVFMGSGQEGALLLVLFNLSHAAEEFLTARATMDVRNLKGMSPEVALVVQQQADGSYTTSQPVSVPVRKVGLNETILVRAGEIVPLDGEIVHGASSVNLEHLTGESLPSRRSVGDLVAGGAVCIDGALIVKVQRTYKDSTLTRIVQLARGEQRGRATVQRWLDTFSEAYSRCVIGASVLVMALWPVLFKVPLLSSAGVKGSIYRGLSFMVAASPCALAMAPLAYVAAISACARQGILLKGGRSLDALATCTVVGFDKTGTLTTGELACTGMQVVELSSYQAAKPVDAKFALAVAAALEQSSNHPIARAIAAYVKHKDLPAVVLDDVRVISGSGVEGTVQLNGSTMHARIGGLSFISSALSTADAAKLTSAIGHARLNDAVVAALLLDGQVVVFRLTDSLRPLSAQAVGRLRNSFNFRVLMLTGDRLSSAQRVAAQVGIEEVFADLKPEDKLAHVKSLNSSGQKLVMVGEGLNDAPALAAATTGVVMASRASAAAAQAADVLLLRDAVDGVPYVLAKAVQTTTIVRQSVALALLCIAVAALPSVLGAIPLWLTVVLHEGGTVLVCLNALRALRSPDMHQGGNEATGRDTHEDEVAMPQPAVVPA